MTHCLKGIDQNETSFFATVALKLNSKVSVEVIIHACMEFYDAGHVE